MRLTAVLIACLLPACAAAEPAEPSAPEIVVAQEPPQTSCITPESAIFVAATNAGSVFADFADVNHFLARFNAYPPATNLAADRIMILTFPHIPYDLVVFFVDGCSVSRNWVRHDLCVRWLSGEST